MWGFLLLISAIAYSADSLTLNSTISINDLDFNIKDHLFLAEKSTVLLDSYRKALRIYEFNMEDYLLNGKPAKIKQFLNDYTTYKLPSAVKTLLTDDKAFVFKTENFMNSSSIFCVVVGITVYLHKPQITTNALNKVKREVNESIFRELLYEKIKI